MPFTNQRPLAATCARSKSISSPWHWSNKKSAESLAHRKETHLSLVNTYYWTQWGLSNRSDTLCNQLFVYLPRRLVCNWWHAFWLFCEKNYLFCCVNQVSQIWHDIRANCGSCSPSTGIIEKEKAFFFFFVKSKCDCVITSKAWSVLNDYVAIQTKQEGASERRSCCRGGYTLKLTDDNIKLVNIC